MKTCQTVDSATHTCINPEIKYWHDVILRIISVIKLLRESSLAFGGTSDKLYEYYRYLLSVNSISKWVWPKNGGTHS